MFCGVGMFWGVYVNKGLLLFVDIIINHHKMVCYVLCLAKGSQERQRVFGIVEGQQEH
jgi:hypothetical protein